MDKNPINSRRTYRVLFISTVTALLFSAINPPIILGSTYSPGVNSSQLHTVIPPQVIGDTVPASQPVTIATETTQVFFPGLFLDSPVMNGLQLNIPQLDGNLGQRMREAGIFWFGKVTPTENYADVRVSYNTQSLLIAVAVFDRLLWADTTPTMAELTEWDAVSVYLSTDPRQGTYPDEDDYKFVVQVNRLDPQAINSRAFFQGDGSGWQSVDLSVSTTVGFRSSTPPFFNDQSDDHGWMMTLEVPFAELGLSGAPPQGSRWRLAARIHDRDDAHGTPIADKVWPVYADEGNPSSWGTVNYGLPTYSPPVHIGETELTIRHRVDGVQVVDGMVGGNSTCGQNLHFWTQWGFANYSGATQVNVQNQWDVADQPCFSKYYIKMPLDQIPPGKVIISSTLTLFHFGNSFPRRSSSVDDPGIHNRSGVARSQPQLE